MLQIVINGNYYKDNVYFSSWNARQKKECVYFYDYDDYIYYIINYMEFSQLQRLRLKLYSKYHDLIKFTRIHEKDNLDGFIEGWHLESPIIDVPLNDFAQLLDTDVRKNFFDYDKIREKYYFKSKFINYVNLNV